MAQFEKEEYEDGLDSTWLKTKVVPTIMTELGFYSRQSVAGLARIVCDSLGVDWKRAKGKETKDHIEWIIRVMIADGCIGAEQNTTDPDEFYNLRIVQSGAVNAENIELKSKVRSLEAITADTARIVKEAQDAVEKASKRKDPVLEIRVYDKPHTDARVMKGHFHWQMPKLLKLGAARKSALLYGPTGSGKSYLAEQAAEVLGLPFAFISCTSGMSEGKLEGRLLPTGKNGAFEYAISEFIRVYEGGGVFCLDEMDACDPNILLIINSALASKKMAVSNRPKKAYADRHPDFWCISTMNTLGTGADRLYPGRNKLDDSTLDRFRIGRLMIDYDLTVEEAMCPDAGLRMRLQDYRQAIRENVLERSISTRFLKDAYEMKTLHGFSDADIDESLFMGWRQDEINKCKA